MEIKKQLILSESILALPLVSSSSMVVFDESVDSFTWEPSLFLAMIDRPWN